MSQGAYKITSAREGRTYTGKHGDLVVWHVRLHDSIPTDVPSGEYELHKKPGNTPQVGDEIEVDRFAPGQSPDGTPFVRIFAASSFAGGGSSTGAGGGSTAARTPDQQKSIVRQHSQEMALRLIEATGDAKDLNLSDAGLAGTYLNGTVKRLTNWFAQDALPERAAPAPTVNGGGGEVPADTTGLPSTAPLPQTGPLDHGETADDDIPF